MEQPLCDCKPWFTWCQSAELLVPFSRPDYVCSCVLFSFFWMCWAEICLSQPSSYEHILSRPFTLLIEFSISEVCLRIPAIYDARADMTHWKSNATSPNWTVICHHHSWCVMINHDKSPDFIMKNHQESRATLACLYSPSYHSTITPKSHFFPNFRVMYSRYP